MNTLTINNIDNAAYVWDRLAWDSSIRELSANEIDEVNGGIAPVIIAALILAGGAIIAAIIAANSCNN